MLLLGFDTATPAVTVALHDGARTLAEVTSQDAHQAERLAPSVADVLAAAGADRRDLTAIAVGVGPGPFTGLRVGVVTARVIGAALGIPVYGVCTLDIIAADAGKGGSGTLAADAGAPGKETGPSQMPRALAGPGGNGGRESPVPEGGRPADDSSFLVATDARRREVYWASYDGRGRRQAGPFVGPPASIPDRDRLTVGQGPVVYPEFFLKRNGPVFPAASALCRVVIARAVPLLEPEPMYLRRPDAREPGRPKRVTVLPLRDGTRPAVMGGASGRPGPPLVPPGTGTPPSPPRGTGR